MSKEVDTCCGGSDGCCGDPGDCGCNCATVEHLIIEGVPHFSFWEAICENDGIMTRILIPVSELNRTELTIAESYDQLVAEYVLRSARIPYVREKLEPHGNVLTRQNWPQENFLPGR